jgi:hypothetical protein
MLFLHRRLAIITIFYWHLKKAIDTALGELLTRVFIEKRMLGVTNITGLINKYRLSSSNKETTF